MHVYMCVLYSIIQNAKSPYKEVTTIMINNQATVRPITTALWNECVVAFVLLDCEGIEPEKESKNERQPNIRKNVYSDSI